MNYDVINRTSELDLRDGGEDPAHDLSGIWVAGASNTFDGSWKTKTYSAQPEVRVPVRQLASEGHGLTSQTLVMRMLDEQGPAACVILGITMCRRLPITVNMIVPHAPGSRRFNPMPRQLRAKSRRRTERAAFRIPDIHATSPCPAVEIDTLRLGKGWHRESPRCAT